MAKEIVAACRNGDLEKVKDLVEQQHVDPNERVEDDERYRKAPLHWAAHFGRLEVIKYLVEKCKCDPMVRDGMWKNTPLHWAVRYASLEVVKYLVEDCNCEIMCRNIRENTPLHDAALGGQLEVVALLVSKKSCDPGVVGRWGRTPLHYACEGGSVAVVKFLLESSGYNNPSCKDGTGLTPLHIAASQGSLSIVQYLIEEQECKMESKDHHGETPLHEAIKGGRLDVMKYLISQGCDPMRGGKSGGTALHHACQHGRMEEVKYLIADNNLAIDSPCDNSGASPLHVAAVNGRLDVVKLLVETFLCQLNVRDSNGQTPLELAQDKHEKEIVSYLRDMDGNSGNLRTTLLKQLRPNTKQVIPTGKVLGSGAYGSVIELRCEGKIVAGKIFRTMSRDHTIIVQKKIKDELNIMMEVDHPNIVQTMGVCFLPNEPLPVLLMERMEYNLHSYLLDPKHFSLTIQTKLSILCDIANGLTCLHNHKPPIIHRDLTANNVLLNSGPRAKIADFGNSEILSSLPVMYLGTLTSLQQSLEGNEALNEMSESSPSLDVFQFGHLALSTTIREPIRPLLPPTYTDKVRGVLRARSEVERRQLFVRQAEQLLSRNHSLVKLIKQCLHNDPSLRPSAEELLTTLQKMEAAVKSKQGMDFTPELGDAVSPIPETTLPIHGADNVGEMTLQVVPGEPLNYYWEEYGLRLHIPAYALDISTSLTMKIQASLSGQFELPDDMELVSGVYWISFPAKSLVQPVTLELQHCARLESAEQTRLTFVTSQCNQETLPYQFEPLPGGVFTTSSDYGTVQLFHFSGVAVAGKKRRRSKSHSREQEGDSGDKTAEQSVTKKYVALTYYKQARSARIRWEMHFTMIPNLDLRLKTLENHYPKEEIESCLRKTVVFQKDKVTLDIPEAGIVLPSGWSIVPKAHPASLTQSEVDSYVDSIPPSCQLDLHLQRTEQPYEGLSHQVKIVGIQGISTITIARDIDPELSAGAVVLGKRKHELEGESSTDTKRQKPDDSEPQGSNNREVLPHLDPIILSTDDLYDIYSELLPVANKWKNIGLALRLSPNSLNTISTKENVTDCLMEVLTQWLKKTYNVKRFGEPSWKLLVKAVSDQAGGNDRALAEKIAQNHQVPLDKT